MTDDLLQLKHAELAASIGVVDRQQKDLEASVDLVQILYTPAFGAIHGDATRNR
jgi:hypothetical protein